MHILFLLAMRHVQCGSALSQIINESVVYVYVNGSDDDYAFVLRDNPYESNIKIKRNRFVYYAQFMDDDKSYGYFVLRECRGCAYGTVISRGMEYTVQYEYDKYRIHRTVSRAGCADDLLARDGISTVMHRDGTAMCDRTCYRIVLVNDYGRTMSSDDIGAETRRMFVAMKEYFDGLHLGIELVLVDVLNMVEDIDYMSGGRMYVKGRRTVVVYRNGNMELKTVIRQEPDTNNVHDSNRDGYTDDNNDNNDNNDKENDRDVSINDNNRDGYTDDNNSVNDNDNTNNDDDARASVFLSNFADTFDYTRNIMVNSSLNRTNLIILLSSTTVSDRIDALTFIGGACSLSNGFSVLFNTPFAQQNAAKILTHEVLHSLSIDHGTGLMAETNTAYAGLDMHAKEQVLQYINKHRKCFHTS